MDKDLIRATIAKGRLAEALKIMLSELPEDQQNDVLIWQNRLNGLERSERLGTIGTADAGLERNKIVAAVLEYLSSEPTIIPPKDSGSRSSIPRLQPVIFTAFANPKGDLVNLTKEQNGIQDILMPLVRSGKIKNHLVRTDTDMDAYFDFMREWENQICIFHYAGHANSEGITLQNAHTFFEPLARELTIRNQDVLQLVFLNGCSTYSHIKILFDLGVKAVIATAVSINDDLAMHFAMRFYKNLAAGDTLDRAYQSAANYIKGKHTSEKRFQYFGRTIRDINIPGFQEDPPEGSNAAVFPWGLYVNGGDNILNQVLLNGK